jgi:putative copper export protein
MAVLEPLGLFVRWAHVVGMAAILGGALLVLWLTARPSGKGAGDVRLEIAQRYEWTFWAAIGVQAMTGVGNLGAFGQGLPAPTTAWGQRLTVKLVVVLALALLSLPRTLAVSVLMNRPTTESGRSQVVPSLYAATVMLVLVVVALAVWLAHG